MKLAWDLHETCKKLARNLQSMAVILHTVSKGWMVRGRREGRTVTTMVTSDEAPKCYPDV